MDRNWKLVRLRLKMRVLVVYLVFSCFGLCWSLNEEGLALLRLRERVVSDPFGALSNWNDKDGVVDACSWFGVECCDRKVVALNLKDLCLEGSLAPELRSLVHIKSIILRNNSFAGIIPEGLGKLKELEVLDLGYNNFSGPLPLDLGSNLSLTILLLDNNELLGSLPPEINELQMLSELQIDEKQLADAPKGSSGSKRFITSNFIRIEDTVQRRLLQDARLSDSSTFLPSPSASPSSESPSTSPPSESPSTFAAGSAAPLKEPAPNQIPTTPNVSSLPPPVPSPIPSSKSPGSSSKDNILAILAGLLGAAVLLLLVFGLCLFRSNAVSTVKPWRTGLSGQLQKVFVTGVPKLKRSELEAACEDFSNVIGSSPIGTVYKGTLSSGVEIAVASVAVASGEDWSRNLEIQFRKKIDTLSKVNHKNFVNLLGYCEEEEPFTRMIVFEYAPNGTLFEHLHIKESEPLDWGMRLRIAMGMAYCLDHMHQLDPPIAHSNLTSSSVNLTEDFAAKISDYSFWNEIAAAEVETSGKKLSNAPLIHPESNVYSYGVLLFEMMTGRLPYSVDNGSLENWASEYLRGEQPLEEIVDPTLTSFDEEQLEEIEDVIRACVHSDPKHRPTMREVTARLRDITGISPDGAIPKLSPLWWAELEILSTEAM